MRPVNWLFIVLLAAGCAADVGNEPQGATAPLQKVTIASLPNATCELIGPSGQSKTLRPNSEGLVRFMARPSAKVLTLDCDETVAGGVHARYAVDLNAPNAFDPATPRVNASPRRMLPGMINPERVSPEQVAAAGYPPRPEPGTARYETWMRMVSSPMTMMAQPAEEPIADKLLVRNVHNDRWGGIALERKSYNIFVRYTDAGGWAHIPDYETQPDDRSLGWWVGLGGVNDDNVIWAGYWLDAGPDYVTFDIVYDWEPDTGALLVWDMDLSPGDDLYVEVYECDSNGLYGPTRHGKACYWIWNETTGETFSQRLTPMAGVTYQGKSCENVIERLDWGSSLGPLAGWGGLISSTFDCWDSGQQVTRNLTTDAHAMLYMDNPAGLPMLTPTKASPDRVYFDWRREQ